MRASRQVDLALESFDPFKSMKNALSTSAPWESIVDFATHPSFCNFKLYPRQKTLLKMIFLETENMTSYDVDVINQWAEGFMDPTTPEGVQPDIWERIEYLKGHGYRRFPHIQAVLGRRASKGVIGGILGAEHLGYMYSLDDWQSHYGLPDGKDGYLFCLATNQLQAKRFQFADIRQAVERCKYLQPAISTSKEYMLTLRTPADLRRIARMHANGVPVEREVASLRVMAMSANSASGRGATSFGNVFDEFAHMLSGTGSTRTSEEVYECLDPKTPVRMSDGTLKPIGEVEVGEYVLGVDEHSTMSRPVPTKVIDKWDTKKGESYEIEMEDGTVVKCSANHGWLTQRGWVKTSELTEDDEILQAE